MKHMSGRANNLVNSIYTGMRRWCIVRMNADLRSVQGRFSIFRNGSTKSVIFSTDTGYIVDGAFWLWRIYSTKVPEWLLKSSDEGSQWKVSRLTTDSWLNPILGIGYNIWYLGPYIIYGTIFGIWHHIWYLISYLELGRDIGDIDLSLEYKLHILDACGWSRYELEEYSAEYGRHSDSFR